MSQRHYDALIVGARCAGASTALLLARQGARVLLVDRTRAGDDTISTHALMRGGVKHLHKWGILDRVIASGTPAVRRTCFTYGGTSFGVNIKPEAGIDALYAPRRTVLDRLLADAAVEAGAELHYDTSLDSLVFGADGRVSGAVLISATGVREVTADIVIGADGVRSTVAALVGAEVTRAERNAAAALYGYVSGLEDYGYQWAFTPGSSAGAIPTNDGLHCVFVSFSRDRRGEILSQGSREAYDRLIRQNMPWISDSVVSQVPRLRAFGGISGFLRCPIGRGWALVGDAGYFKDPVTAHGITDALRDAELLSRAVGIGTDWAMEDYQAIRDDLSLPLMRVTDRIAGYGWSLSELQALHVELNNAMKNEIAVLSQLSAPATGGLEAA